MRNLRNWYVPALLLLAVLAGGCTKEAKRDRHLKRGDAYFAAGDYGKAEIEYWNVLKNDGDNTNAIRQLGIVFMEQGRMNSAWKPLEIIRRKHPNDVEIRARYAQWLMARGGFKQALDEARFVLSKVPDHAEALLLAAELAKTPEDIQWLNQHVQQSAQKTGPRAAYAAASAFLFAAAKDAKNAENELKRALTLDPKFPPAHLVLGQLYVSQGDTNRGEAEIKLGSELSPLRSTRHLRYADYKIRTGAVQEGRGWTQKVVEKAPDFLPAWLLLAQLDFAATNLDSCERAINRVLTKEPLNYEALLMRGNLLVAREKYDRAIRHWEEVVASFAKDPIESVLNNPDPYYQLAVVQLKSGNVLEAQSSLTKSLTINTNVTYAPAFLLRTELEMRQGGLAAAMGRLERFVQEQPDFRAYLLLATGYQMQQEPDKAVAIYKKLATSFPQSPQPPYLAGLVLAGQTNRVEARKQFEKAAALAPEDPDVVNQLVALDVAENQVASALQRIQRLMDRSPKSPAAYMLLARVQSYQAGLEKDPAARATALDKVEKSLLKALELEPGYTLAYEALIQLYSQTGKQDQAVARLESWVKTKNKDAGAFLQLGMLYDARKDFTKAKAAYEKTVEIQPKMLVAHNNLAYLYSERMQDQEKALEHAKKAFGLAPTNAYVLDTYGWIQFQRGEYDEALQLLRQAATGLGAEVQWHLGMVHYTLGNEAEALAAFQKALSLEAAFTGRTEAEQRVKLLLSNTRSGDPAAVAALEKLLSEQPTEPLALSRLGAVYESQQAYDKDTAMWDKAAQANPKAVQALLRNAARRSPGSAVALYRLGRVSYQLKDRATARTSLNAALQSRLPGRPAEEAKRMLAELK